MEPLVIPPFDASAAVLLESKIPVSSAFLFYPSLVTKLLWTTTLGMEEESPL